METLRTKQHIFNEIKGKVVEWKKDEEWSNLVIQVGHDNKRMVNFVCKSGMFDHIISNIKLEKGLFLLCRFYISSRKTNDRYYTNATLLSVSKVANI